MRLKPLGLGEAIELLGDGVFERHRGGDVAHLPAVGAKEMVVVFREVLGELEAVELVAGRDAPNEARRLQIGRTSVRRISSDCPASAGLSFVCRA